jgi:stress-induced morphogen
VARPSGRPGGGWTALVSFATTCGVELQSRIDQKLRERLAPSVLEVINESAMHSVPRGSETHFKVIVVSRAFEGKSAVERHRLVYDALDQELRAGVHALAITSRTPEEWARTNSVAASPPCLGGSKSTS